MAPEIVVLPRRPVPERETWVSYKTNPTTQARNAIIEAYLPLLRSIAAGVHKRLPMQVEMEELVSAGCFGLMDAIDKYDPDKNTQFSTFCSQRVRGSIIDELRAMDLPPRQVREHEALVKKIWESFVKQFGRPPCDEEVLTRLGGDSRRAGKILRNSRVTQMASLSESVNSSIDHPLRVEEVIADRRRISGLSAAILQDMRDFVFRRLSRTERLVIILYYYERMTMKEIGKVLGLSESRVSQIREVLLAKLDSWSRTRAIDTDH